MASEIEETRRTCQEVKRKASEERTVTCECGWDAGTSLNWVRWENGAKWKTHTWAHIYVFMYMNTDNCMDTFYRGFTVMAGQRILVVVRQDMGFRRVFKHGGKLWLIKVIHWGDRDLWFRKEENKYRDWSLIEAGHFFFFLIYSREAEHKGTGTGLWEDKGVHFWLLLLISLIFKTE